MSRVAMNQNVVAGVYEVCYEKSDAPHNGSGWHAAVLNGPVHIERRVFLLFSLWDRGVDVTLQIDNRVDTF